MTTTYDRASALVHLVSAPGDRHALAIGPENQPIVVGEALPLGPAEKRLTAVRRALAIAFEQLARDVREAAAHRAERFAEGDYLDACCATTAREIAQAVER